VRNARALVLQVPYDVKIRPALAALTAEVPPPGFTRIDRQPIGMGARCCCFA
jgi:hypothetical protein